MRDSVNWSEKAELAFDKVKEAVHQCPRLLFVDENERIYVHTDASNVGIGEYMFQIIDGEEKPVAFITKAYDQPMMKWCLSERGIRNLLWVENMEASVVGLKVCVKDGL